MTATTPATPDDTARWLRAFKLVLPSSDLETRDFLIACLRENDLMAIADDFEMPDLADMHELPLFAVLAEHLETLCGVPSEEVPLLVQDLIDEYLAGLDEPLDTAAAGFITPRSTCELCERNMPLTIHHLYPRSEHDYLLRRGVLATDEAGQPLTRHDLLVTHRALLCRPCHSAVHRLIANRDLAEGYHDLPALRGHEAVARWIGYARKQRPAGRDHQRLGLRYRR